MLRKLNNRSASTWSLDFKWKPLSVKSNLHWKEIVKRWFNWLKDKKKAKNKSIIAAFDHHRFWRHVENCKRQTNLKTNELEAKSKKWEEQNLPRCELWKYFQKMYHSRKLISTKKKCHNKINRYLHSFDFPIQLKSWTDFKMSVERSRTNIDKSSDKSSTSTEKRNKYDARIYCSDYPDSVSCCVAETLVQFITNS